MQTCSRKVSIFPFYLFLSYRQRYVELLERIPRQMRTLYREMMAQRVMDKHITDELFHFKQAIGQLTRSRSGSLLLFHFVNKNCDY